MIMPRLSLAGALALTAFGSAQASSPADWAKLRKDAEAACIKASGLTSARITDYADLFQGHVVLAVEGVHPQKHMQGAKGRMLCLYDKRTLTVETAEPAKR